MKNLLSVISAVDGLSDAQALEIANLFEKVEIDRNEHLYFEGESCPWIWIIESGAVAVRYLHNAEEHTQWVYFETEVVTSWHAFMLEEKSMEYAVTLEPLVAYRLHFNDVQKYKAENSSFLAFWLLTLEYYMGIFDAVTKKVLTMDAKEKYINLVENNPMMSQRVSQKDMASIIGVSRETLSRIKGQVLRGK